MIDLEKLKKSLLHLELQFWNWQRASSRAELTDLDREGIGESVIQRFETCYDSLWKALKRYMEEEVGIADLPNSPKPLFKIASQSSLLPSGVEQWLRYADTRTSTAHDYSGEKAQECLAIMNDFVNDAINLFQTLSGSPWKP